MTQITPEQSEKLDRLAEALRGLPNAKRERILDTLSLAAELEERIDAGETRHGENDTANDAKRPRTARITPIRSTI